MPAAKKTRKSRKAAEPATAGITAEGLIEFAKSLDAKARADLAEVLGVAPSPPTDPTQSRRVSTRPQIAEPEVLVEIPDAPPPDVPTANVVYKSPHMGFHQVLSPSRKIPMGDGDVERVPPKMAIFDRGTWVPNDEEEVELMDRKIEKKRRLGLPIEVKKIENPVAREAAIKGVKPIASQDGITVDTPAEELVR